MSAEDPLAPAGGKSQPPSPDAEATAPSPEEPVGTEGAGSLSAAAPKGRVGFPAGEDPEKPEQPAAPPRPVAAILGNQIAPPSGVRRKDKVTGMSIVFVTFLATLSLAWWAKYKNTPVPAEPPAPPDPAVVVGFPSAVDAIATLPEARKRTPREVLRGILLRGVNSQGLVDTTLPDSEVRYVFQSRAGEGPQPARDPDGRPGRPYCGKQVVRVKAEGLQEDEDETKYSCGTKGIEPLPEPRCGPKQVWEHAAAKEIPTDKPAQIEYYRAKAGPAWRFRIPGTRHRFSVYGDCERELKGLDEVGSIP